MQWFEGDALAVLVVFEDRLFQVELLVIVQGGLRIGMVWHLSK